MVLNESRTHHTAAMQLHSGDLINTATTNYITNLFNNDDGGFGRQSTAAGAYPVARRG